MNNVTVKIRIARAKEIDRPRPKIQRQTVRQAGAIRRISVAVLVDGIITTGTTGEPVWEPRPAAELTALRDLVVAAIGFDEARGDIVTGESMAFQPDATEGALVETSGFMRSLERNALTLIQIAALALVALVLGLTVIRPILTRPLPDPATATLIATAPGAASEVTMVEGGAPASLPAPEGDDAAPVPDSETLRTAVAEQPDQSVSMLREWLAPADLASTDLVPRDGEAT